MCSAYWDVETNLTIVGLTLWSNKEMWTQGVVQSASQNGDGTVQVTVQTDTGYDSSIWCVALHVLCMQSNDLRGSHWLSVDSCAGSCCAARIWLLPPWHLSCNLGPELKASFPTRTDLPLYLRTLLQVQWCHTSSAPALHGCQHGSNLGLPGALGHQWQLQGCGQQQGDPVCLMCSHLRSRYLSYLAGDVHLLSTVAASCMTSTCLSGCQLENGAALQVSAQSLNLALVQVTFSVRPYNECPASKITANMRFAKNTGGSWPQIIQEYSQINW